eukprot:1989458-Rhodomonas_salina.2
MITDRVGSRQLTGFEREHVKLLDQQRQHHASLDAALADALADAQRFALLWPPCLRLKTWIGLVWLIGLVSLVGFFIGLVWLVGLLRLLRLVGYLGGCLLLVSFHGSLVPCLPPLPPLSPPSSSPTSSIHATFSVSDMARKRAWEQRVRGEGGGAGGGGCPRAGACLWSLSLSLSL